jgi:hypothetical protein
MKNMKYDHFERNRYFLGKLLSVSDFETEQRYFNDKRRWMNRLFHGAGIVCGLSVSQVDGETLSVDPGAALDCAGREILIPAGAVYTLSSLDGYTPNPLHHTLYLCLEYSETEADPIHSLSAATGQTTESLECNKYAEGFRLYLTEERPAPGADRLLRHNLLIYEDQDLRVTQSMNRFLRSGRGNRLTVAVEKLSETDPIAFHYTLQSPILKDIQGQNPLRVDFDEAAFSKADSYVFDVPFQVDVLQDTVDHVSILDQTLTLSAGGEETPRNAAVSGFDVVIGKESAEDRLAADYFSQTLEERLLNTDGQRLCLAAITVGRQDGRPTVKKVVSNPFGQNLPTAALVKLLQEYRQNQEPAEYEPSSGETAAGIPQESAFERFKSEGWYATGVEDIKFGANTQKDNHTFSKEIIHGLGKGPVFIVLGLEEHHEIQPDAAPYGDHMVFGNQDVFLRSSLEKVVPLVSMGALANAGKGTFQIGVKLLKNTEHTSCRVRWWAYKHASDMDPSYLNDGVQPSISVSPDIAQLKLNEVFRFEVTFKNVPPSLCKFSVKEPDGGGIDPNGVYTAPAHEGLFEIQVENIANPALKASAFAVIKERS